MTYLLAVEVREELLASVSAPNPPAPPAPPRPVIPNNCINWFWSILLIKFWRLESPEKRNNMKMFFVSGPPEDNCCQQISISNFKLQ